MGEETMSEFFTALANIGHGTEADPDRLRIAIEAMEAPRHARFVATWRTELRKHPHLVELYCERVLSFAKLFSRSEVAELRSYLGEAERTVAEIAMLSALERATKNAPYMR
jgi:hypothetical protein